MADFTSIGNFSSQVLTSRWDGLNPYLVASIFEVEKQDAGGTAWRRKESTPIVRAPLVDPTLEIDLQWQSPFENAGPEQKAPALSALLQSGALQPTLDALMGQTTSKEAQNFQKTAADNLQKFEGRTGITKLNSTQIFNGMPPVKISGTVFLRAWLDGAEEVEKPLDQLMQWALPEELSTDASILARAAEQARNNGSFIETLLPSKSPVRVGLTYKGRTIMPLVIESVSLPWSSPINAAGNFIQMSLQVTLCSLTAIDRADWRNFKTVPFENIGLV